MALLGAVIVAALLYTLAFPPFSQSWLAWVAVVPMYCAMRSRGAVRGVVLAAVWAVLSTLGVMAWLLPTLAGMGEPWAATAGLWGAYGLVAAAPYFAGAFGLYVWARPPISNSRPLAVISRPLLWAMAWVAAEAARMHVGIRSPWGLLGESQAGFAQLRQVAEFAGVYGVSFVVAWVNAAIGEALCCLRGVEPEAGPDLDEPPIDPLHLGRERAVVAAVPALLTLAIATTYGSFRLDPSAWRTESIRGAAIQGTLPYEFARLASGLPGRDLAHEAGTSLSAIDPYRVLVDRALRPSAGGSAPEILLLPENALPSPVREPADLAPLIALARLGTPILVGVERLTSGPVGEGRRASATVLRPNGDVEHYDKQWRLPFHTRGRGKWDVALEALGWQQPVRDLEAGRHPAIFSLGSSQLGVLLGTEALYPDLARDLAARGAALLVNPADDALLIGPGAREQHLAQIVFRAVETGLPLVRSSAAGISAVVSPTGEVVAQAAQDEPAVLSFHVATDPEPLAGATFYTLFGDVFVAGCGLSLLGIGLAGEARRRLKGLRSGDRDALGISR